MFSLGSAKADERDADRASRRRSVVARAEEMPIPTLGHPSGSGEMRGVNFRRSAGVRCGVEAEEEFDNFLPGSAICLGVEEPQIKLEVRLIVGGEIRAHGRFIKEVFFGHDKPHGTFVSSLEGFVNRNDSANQRRIVTACRKIAMVERARAKTSRIVLVTNQHHSHALAGVEEDDATAFEGPTNLIAR